MTISVINSARLIIRPLTLADVDFVIAQFNEPDVLNYIGNRQIITVEDAKNYIVNGRQLSYQQHGIGSMAICLKENDSVAIGLAGLLKRAELDYPDLGYSLLSKYYHCGYGKEAATAVLGHYSQYKTILAQVNPDNKISKALLIKLNFEFSHSNDAKTTEIFKLSR
ncbi:MAG: GNAT family N-acetyltransferase [Colwellia sp.]|nr:GNAT family N-acetyltransferase [Colwellia sp.]